MLSFFLSFFVVVDTTSLKLNDQVGMVSTNVSSCRLFEWVGIRSHLGIERIGDGVGVEKEIAELLRNMRMIYWCSLCPPLSL